MGPRAHSAGFTTWLLLSSVLTLQILTAGRTAWALTFSASPVRIFLSKTQPAQTVILRNESDEEERFQLSAFKWNQKPAGGMELTATDEVVFFPILLNLKPGQERKVRVGLLALPDETEKTYRLSVEELAPFRKASTDGEPSVRLLMTITLPIFVAPRHLKAEALVEETGVSHGVFSFKVRNTGSAHISVQEVRVTGLGEASQVVFSKETRGCYVLAGGSRDYELPIAPEQCAKTRLLHVEVQAEQGPFDARFDVPEGSCSSATASASRRTARTD